MKMVMVTVMGKVMVMAKMDQKQRTALAMRMVVVVVTSMDQMRRMETKVNLDQERVNALQDALQNVMRKGTSRDLWRVDTTQPREGRGRSATVCPAL